MSLPNIFPSNEKSWTKDVKNTLNYFKENLDYIYAKIKKLEDSIGDND